MDHVSHSAMKWLGSGGYQFERFQGQDNAFAAYAAITQGQKAFGDATGGFAKIAKKPMEDQKKRLGGGGGGGGGEGGNGEKPSFWAPWINGQGINAKEDKQSQLARSRYGIARDEANKSLSNALGLPDSDANKVGQVGAARARLQQIDSKKPRAVFGGINGPENEFGDRGSIIPARANRNAENLSNINYWTKDNAGPPGGPPPGGPPPGGPANPGRTASIAAATGVAGAIGLAALGGAMGAGGKAQAATPGLTPVPQAATVAGNQSTSGQLSTGKPPTVTVPSAPGTGPGISGAAPTTNRSRAAEALRVSSGVLSNSPTTASSGLTGSGSGRPAGSTAGFSASSSVPASSLSASGGGYSSRSTADFDASSSAPNSSLSASAGGYSNLSGAEESARENLNGQQGDFSQSSFQSQDMAFDAGGQSESETAPDALCRSVRRNKVWALAIAAKVLDRDLPTWSSAVMGLPPVMHRHRKRALPQRLHLWFRMYSRIFRLPQKVSVPSLAAAKALRRSREAITRPAMPCLHQRPRVSQPVWNSPVLPLLISQCPLRRHPITVRRRPFR